jgi:hypothetical protein
MRRLRVVCVVAASSCFTLFAVSGCDQKAVEDAGDAAKQSVEDAKDAAAGAMDAAGDAARDLSDKLGEGFATAAKNAASALEGVDGGGEMLSGLKDLFGSAQETLSGITDKASAEAAVAKIEEMGASVEGLAKKFEGMPSEAKTAVQGLVEQGVAKLKLLIDKIMANPEIQEVVKPKLDALMAKLRELTGG